MHMCMDTSAVRLNTSSKEMSRQESLPQEERMPQGEVRALRRSLADITPEKSNPQLQSPLFATLPSEVRNLIFEYAVCQTIDPCKSAPETQNARLRPGHELFPVMDTSLLRTCRLIYYETRAIPLRSTTHHQYGDPSTSYDAEDWDHYLFHMSSQSGQHLHHLHTTCWGIPDFNSGFLQQHLHWRKLTWTICASNWDYESEWETNFSYADKICALLHETRFPDTCREVNLEFETLRKNPKHRRRLREVSDKCRKVQLTRRNGSSIELDEEYSMEYTWEGATWQPGDWESGPGDYVSATYHVIRLCWREQESERGYMSYDHWDCLRSKKIKPFPSGYVSEEEG